MIKRAILDISKGMWEPIGIVFAVSIVWSFYQMIFRGKYRETVRWCWLLGALGALLWRWALHIQGIRYHNIFMFFALFCIIDLFETFPLPRMLKRWLFALGLLCCLIHTLIYHPQDRETLNLYQNIQKDAARYPRTLGLGYDLLFPTYAYYTRLEFYGMDRLQPLDEMLRNLKGNLSVYDGDYDAVYLFIYVKKEELDRLPEFDALAPENRMHQMGVVWKNRYRKKALVVYRYTPNREAQTAFPKGELLLNGDFSRSAEPKVRAYLLDSFGKRLPRLYDANFEPPANWSFYASRVNRSDSFFSRVKRADGWALYLEAHGYLCAITPPLTIKEEKHLSFTVKVKQDALLQITRTVPNAGFFPVLVLPMKAGMEKRYEITLPAYSQSEKSDIWFWLDHGAIELSDVRIR